MGWYPGRLLGRRGYEQQPPTVEQQRETFRQEWLAKGATPAQVDKALLLAEDWADSLSRFSSGGDPRLQAEIKQVIYPKALNTTAANWLASINAQRL